MRLNRKEALVSLAGRCLIGQYAFTSGVCEAAIHVVLVALSGVTAGNSLACRSIFGQEPLLWRLGEHRYLLRACVASHGALVLVHARGIL